MCLSPSPPLFMSALLFLRGKQHASRCCHSWSVLGVKHDGRCALGHVYFVSVAAAVPLLSASVWMSWIFVLRPAVFIDTLPQASCSLSFLTISFPILSSLFPPLRFLSFSTPCLSYPLFFSFPSLLHVDLSLVPFFSFPFASPYLHYRPVVRLAQQLDDSWDTVVQPHGILCQFSVLVAGGEVTQGAYRRLSNILLLSSTKHGMNQRLYTAILSHQSLWQNRLKGRKLSEIQV